MHEKPKSAMWRGPKAYEVLFVSSDGGTSREEWTPVSGREDGKNLVCEAPDGKYYVTPPNWRKRRAPYEELVAMLEELQAHRFKDPRKGTMNACTVCGRVGRQEPSHDAGCIVGRLTDLLDRAKHK